MKSFLICLAIACCASPIFQVLRLNQWIAAQNQIAKDVCEFVQNDAQVGDVKGAVDQADHLFRSHPQGQRAWASYEASGVDFGPIHSELPRETLNVIACKITGSVDHQLSFYFLKPPFFSTELALYALICFFITSVCWLISKYVLSRIVESLSLLISSGLAYELGIKEQSAPNSKSVRMMSFFLARFVKDIRPEIETLKEASLEKIRLQTEADQGQEFVRAVKQTHHDLLSPLSSLKLISPQLSNEPELQRQILNITNRIESVTEDLSNREGILFSLDTLQMDTVETAVAEVIFEKSAQTKAKVTFDFDHSELALVSVQRGHFRRLISNIVQNAFEATGADGALRITSGKKNGLAFLKISDNGKGMPPESLRNAFTPGFTSGKKSGTGLGLKHAKACIERWGGSITIASKDQQGTTVEFTLPLHTSTLKMVGPSYLRKDATKILVVMDDQPEFLKILPVFRLDKDLFMEPLDFLKWFPEEADPDEHMISADYHLREEFDGIDVLRKIPKAFSRILTTDDYLNPKVHAASDDIGFVILPKPLLRLPY